MRSVEFAVFAAFAGTGFLLEAYFFAPSKVADFAILLKNASSVWSPSLTRVTADIDLGWARLWERYYHASHAWHQLCESASSCSAICPRPGSLIREESCGKVYVSLLNAPHSLQLFVRVGPQQQHRGARDDYAVAEVWGAHSHCENRKGEKLERVYKNTRQVHILWG